MSQKPHSSEPAVSSILRVHPRFMRSVHLERDIRDPRSSLGYILTPVAKQALERVLASFRPRSTQRAWRLAGDYGAGKTDFALALARVARGAKDELPREMRQFAAGHPSFRPALATGDNEPLGATVLRAIGVRLGGKRPAPQAVLAAVQHAVRSARRGRHAGILLILDELGKNLEYAARNPESDDIFLLQGLAEEAARSGENGFVMVAMLHQGVSAYSAGLGSAARREWEKVAGRFEEIVYAQPLEQVAALVAATLNVDTQRLSAPIKKEAELAMRAALDAGLYGTGAAPSLVELGPKIFPLHPAVLPVLVRAMRRFGQNERSLFSFLCSAEPLALQHHASQPLCSATHYRIHHLLDYVRQSLLPSAAMGHAHTQWGVIEAVLASASPENDVEAAVLKTVAMLSLLDAPDLPITPGSVALAVGGDQSATERAIATLRKRGVLYERGTIKGLCLWPHTSVNLEEAFAKAVAATSGEGRGIERLCEHVRSEQLVPRAYYVRTGTLRHAEVKLVPASALADLLANQPMLDPKTADLNARVLIPANNGEQRIAIQVLKEQRATLIDGLLVAVADPPIPALAALNDLVAWEWLKRNTPALSGDHYARSEVDRQISVAEKNVRRRLGGLDNLAVPNTAELTWFSNSMTKSIGVGRALLSALGEECERIYPKTPRVLNELINRRTPSKAAVAARTKLVEAMATSPDKPNLGMDDTLRPAEMGLYLSIVRAGGFHVKRDSTWLFRPPSTSGDACRLLPVLEQMTRTIRGKTSDALVPVPEVFEVISRPPFGIRDGLQPFILAIYLATYHHRVALYEDGTYVDEVGGDEFLRLMKEPQFFHLQYCELDIVRADILAKLMQLLKIDPRDAARADLIDLVRPLSVFISREVPEYARKSTSLPVTAVAVRRALLGAREPLKLVFTALPEACGLPPVGQAGLKAPGEFASRLRTALHDIRMAYPKLLERLGVAVCAAFDVSAAMPAGRLTIAGRAAQLAAAVTEPALKAFALRLADGALEDRAWIESLANLLARKSPERWADTDEVEFHHQLEVAAARFKRTELAMIGTTRLRNGHACRIALTRSDGTEVGDLVDWAGMEESRIRPVEDEIEKILSRHGRHGLAAAMRAIWSSLTPGGDAGGS